MKKERNHFHAKSSEQVLSELGSSVEGLTKSQVGAKRVKFGFNEIQEEKQVSRFIIFVRQIKNLVVYILFVAAIISFLLDRIIDVYVILAAIALNTIIGYVQETKAESAIRSLRKMVVQKTKVYRGGNLVQISARELVPGDIILVEEGDKIPADARLIEVNNLRTVESSLTGESLPVDKSLKVLASMTALADQKNMIWLGTFVASGKAKAVVVATGQNTSLGRLAQVIQEIKPRKSHFQKKTDELAKYLALIAAVGSAVIFIVGFFLRDIGLGESLIFTLASLVSAIPEGLPAILASVLAIGAFRMAKKNAIIRDRYATETLGVVDTIITDKTGTITQNTMCVQSVILPGQKEITVTGSGWNPVGEFFQNNNAIVPLENVHLDKLLNIFSVCNNSKLIKKQHDGYEIIGDPTEAALMVLAEKAGLKNSVLLEKEKRIDEMPFSAELKYHASLSVLVQNNQKEVYVVGSPEKVLQSSLYILKNGRKTKPTENDLGEIEKEIERLTSKAMRVIAAAYKEVSSDVVDLHEPLVDELIFVGLAGMYDPPRANVAFAVEKAKTAGIRVIMATGDHKNTALAIAKEVGIVNKGDNAVLTEQELSKFSESEFERAVSTVSVFARLTPAMKLKIAQALQKQGKIVAMTGDGVNDAPCLKQADVGVAMGKIGTDVARDASQLILADDNFSSIVSAIEEGRIVFVNTRQTTFFLVSTALAQQATVVATLLIGLPLPLLPTQVLWLNIVTGGVTDMALATEKSNNNIINDKPRKKEEPILNREIIPFFFVAASVMMVLTIASFIYYLQFGEKEARTAAFIVLSFTQIFSMYNLRSLKDSLFTIGIFTNKYVNAAFVVSVFLLVFAIYFDPLRDIFGFIEVPVQEFFVLASLSLFVLVAGETYKFYKRKKEARD